MLFDVFFFFKQKTAYEIGVRLVGSEMCIRDRYRYHHLFADLLKQRLLLLSDKRPEKLYSKACDWFEQNGMFEFALKNALIIKNYEKSIQILGEIVEGMWENGLHTSILKYCDCLL